jgi:hypothetical protein
LDRFWNRRSTVAADDSKRWVESGQGWVVRAGSLASPGPLRSPLQHYDR